MEMQVGNEKGLRSFLISIDEKRLKSKILQDFNLITNLQNSCKP